MKNLLTAFVPVLLIASWSFGGDIKIKSWGEASTLVSKKLNMALSDYKTGDIAKTKELLTDAYFGDFEGTNFETAVRLNISGKRAIEIEGMFGEIRRLAGAKADYKQVSAKASELIKALKFDALTLDKEKVSTEITFK